MKILTHLFSKQKWIQLKILFLALLVALAGCNMEPVYLDDTTQNPGTNPDSGSAALSVGGTVSGMSGTGLVLQNNGADDLTVDANGSFQFTTLLKEGDTYNVTVKTAPTGQGCSVSSGSGTMPATSITNVTVTCSAKQGVLKDINTIYDSGEPENFVTFNGKVYFRAETGTSGEELWVTDGTTAGTKMVKDINPGPADSYPQYLTVMGSSLYFRANNGTNGHELWKTDGTEAGTVMVKDIASGSTSSSPKNLIDVNGVLYFTANDGTNLALWKSDGTEAGTVKVWDWPNDSITSPDKFTIFNSKLYFIANSLLYGKEVFFYTP